MMNPLEENNRVAMATQGATAAVFSTYFYDAYAAMLPWFIAAVPLIILDLNLGRKKARAKGQDVTFNKSVRMTIDKSFSYICWIMLSATLSMAFSANWIKYAIMGIVYGLEVVSCVKSWLYYKGYDMDEEEFIKIIVKKITGIDFNPVINQDDDNKS